MTGNISAKELGIDPGTGDEGELFKWFLASFLFGKRIQQDIAAQAYRAIVEQHGRDTPHKLVHCSWQQIVDMLGEGHYVRYDESTADRLLKLCRKLNDEYGGKIGNVQRQSESRKDFERRLGEFEGVGPKTVEIFMREAARAWY
jgi:endonuclease III